MEYDTYLFCVKQDEPGFLYCHFFFFFLPSLWCVGTLCGCTGSGGEDGVRVPNVHRRGRPCLRCDHLRLQAFPGGAGKGRRREHPHR